MFPCFLRSLALLRRAAFFCVTCSFTYIRVPFKFVLPIMTSRFTVLFIKLTVIGLTHSPFLFFKMATMSKKLYAHGLIHELSHHFSEAGELATTLVAGAICLHRVVPARSSRVAAGLAVQPTDYNVSLSAFPICPRISLIVQCDRPSLVVLILAGLFSCSSYRCFSSSLAMRLVVSCLRLLSHQSYGTEIVMMFSFLRGFLGPSKTLLLF